VRLFWSGRFVSAWSKTSNGCFRWMPTSRSQTRSSRWLWSSLSSVVKEETIAHKSVTITITIVSRNYYTMSETKDKVSRGKKESWIWWRTQKTEGGKKLTICLLFHMKVWHTSKSVKLFSNDHHRSRLSIDHYRETLRNRQIYADPCEIRERTASARKDFSLSCSRDEKPRFSQRSQNCFILSPSSFVEDRKEIIFIVAARQKRRLPSHAVRDSRSSF